MVSDENESIADADDDRKQREWLAKHPLDVKTSPPRPAIDIDALLLEAGLDGVLAESHVTLVDDEAQVATINALQVEDRKLAAEIKSAEARRKAISGLIKGFFKPGDEALIVSEPPADGYGAEHAPRVVAKMSYPEPTVTVNVEYVKTTFPYPDHLEFYNVKESTPRLLVQPLPE
jgi:hypothetical protein